MLSCTSAACAVCNCCFCSRLSLLKHAVSVLLTLAKPQKIDKQQMLPICAAGMEV